MTKTPRLQQWFDEVWNNANEHFIEDLLHSDAIIHGLGTDNEKYGHEAFKPFYKNFRESFPVVHVALKPIFNNDEFEAADCDVTATNAEGKNVQFTGITIARFRDGKLVEGWNGFDFMSMYQQLGFELKPQ
jgi:predicted ester cyclase